MPTAPVLSFSDSHVHFPPRLLSDFVIHYRGMNFHVHQLVLYLHSDYFRALLGNKGPGGGGGGGASGGGGSDGSAGHKRQRTDAAPIASSSAPSSASALPTAPSSNGGGGGGSSCEQGHARSTQCVHLASLPSGERDSTIDELGLFLCHLYFPSHYRYPPYLPSVDIDLGPRAETASPMFAVAFPGVEDEDFGAELRMHEDHVRPFLNESVLSLAAFFQCGLVVRQCEAVLIRECELVDWTMDCWQTLRLAQRYGLDKALHAACGKYMMMSNGLSEDEIFEQGWASRETLMRLLWSAIVSKRSAETQVESQTQADAQQRPRV